MMKVAVIASMGDEAAEEEMSRRKERTEERIILLRCRCGSVKRREGARMAKVEEEGTVHQAEALRLCRSMSKCKLPHAGDILWIAVSRHCTLVSPDYRVARCRKAATVNVEQREGGTTFSLPLRSPLSTSVVAVPVPYAALFTNVPSRPYAAGCCCRMSTSRSKIVVNRTRVGYCLIFLSTCRISFAWVAQIGSMGKY